MMYCQPEFSYHMQPEYQQFQQHLQYQGNHLQEYQNGGISPYSPTTPSDRPSPSFRIEDILLQNKGGPTQPYGNVYPIDQSYAAFQNGNLTHGCIGEREYEGNNPSLNQLPIYFRLKSTLRTASGRKCRKPRTVFSELQLLILEREFSEHKYLSTPQRTKLADRLGLNQTQVKTWYQNRRMKWKKETSECDASKTKHIETEDLLLDNSNNPEQFSTNRMSDRITCSS
ncbi:brain-specific homeobox protein homolog [Hydractinia symbiolongicarpus]|uniref:brain-specific homeobox protein homolog n=1 Tax=Hydractinia symbiolongicarpus TaxID=13093 RepID=UPI00254D5BF4|nr:brain-specific homeobox protein homolog [Hydractinia symbiolongicarpus]